MLPEPLAFIQLKCFTATFVIELDTNKWIINHRGEKRQLWKMRRTKNARNSVHPHVQI